MKASRQLHRKATNVLLFALPLVAAGPHKIRQIQSNATSSNTGLEGICTSAHINSLVAGFTALPTVAYFTNATANIATNLTFVPNPNGPDYPFTSGLTYCNVSISFKHNNLNDVVSCTLLREVVPLISLMTDHESLLLAGTKPIQKALADTWRRGLVCQRCEQSCRRADIRSCDGCNGRRLLGRIPHG